MTCHYDIPTAAELRDRLRQRIASLERSNAELLAACKAIVRWLDEENNPDRTHAGCVALLTTAEDAARAAIANAEKVVTP